MQNLWSQSEARGMSPLETLVYATRLIGGNPKLALWGGGNTSLKLKERDFLGREVDVLRVKATGANMATIDEKGFAGVRLQDVLAFRSRDEMSDEEMVDILDRTLMEPRGPRPSVETFLHAFIPEPVVLHSHANAILALADNVKAEELVQEVFGGQVPTVGYVRPGFPLARDVAAAYEAHPGAPGLIMLRHGLVTWGQTAEEAYRRHIDIVTRAEEAIERARSGRTVFHPRSFAAPRVSREGDPAAGPKARRDAAAQLLPVLRGLVSRREPLVVRFDDSEAVLAFVDSEEAAALSQVGPVTPDHMLYTKRVACYVPVDDPGDIQGVIDAVKASVAAYEEAYRAYVEARNHQGLPMLDPAPRVILVPGIGMFTTGKSAREAGIVRDLYTAGIEVIHNATALGQYASLTVDEAFAAEYWPLELYKLSLKPKGGELAGKIGLVTGGARGIGRAIARKLLAEGAHVVVTDRDVAQLEAACKELEQEFPTRVAGVPMDVTRHDDVQRAFREAVLAFGGLDILVSNAGIAPTGAVIDMPLEVWERSFAVNSTGHFLVSQAAVRIMKAQGIGGAIVFNCTKNVVVPGPQFAAYSAAKAAEAQLARVLAIEHGPDKIRVNMVNPDSVFTDLWSAEVRQDRARAYGIRVEELEDYYRKQTLLRESVTPEDVANAVFFLVSEASAKTTGCMIPVDGGVRAAFPR